ncbi:RHS repeat-associated core domain-containing protein [Saccharopolyspora dendranthemae]|nr:RHS repeat-associated core domain-containing protein [Saccharopolyspora dendranthemae]
MKALTPLLKKLSKGFGDAGKQLNKIKADGSKNNGPKGAGAPGKNEGPASTKAQNAETPSGEKGPPPSSNAAQSTDRSPDSSGPGSGPGSNSRSSDSPASTRSANADRSLREQGPNPRSQDKLNTCKDPIDVATGQMVLTQTDAEFLGVLPLVIERSHFSAFRTGRWFGPSWMSVLDQRLEVDEAGVSFAAADGTLHHYPTPALGAWVGNGREPRQLGRTEDGAYLLVDPEQERTLHFTRDRLELTSITDREGHQIEIVRDESGIPLEIRHSAGYRVRVETTDGLITALYSTADDGEVELMRYGYDGTRLTEVINDSGRPLRFEYDAADRIVSWNDRNGEWYRYIYDAEGRCVRTEGSGGFLSGTMEYDVENRITYSTDSLGHRSEYHMNQAGQVIKEVDPLGNVTAAEYDAADRLLSSTDALGRTTRSDYGADGNLVATTNPDGTQRRWEYDERDRLITAIAADGTSTSFTYDENGRLSTVTDAVGMTIRHAYDEHGNLAELTDPVGNTTRFEWNAAGLILAITSSTGAITRYERDRFGRVVAEVGPTGEILRSGWTVGGKLSWQQQPDGSVVRFTYDGEGNLREGVDELGNTSRSELTHFDLVAAEIRPDGTRLQFGYDTELRLTSVTNEQGLVWRYEYDAGGNLVRETDFNGRPITYRYDAGGNLTARTDAAGQTTSFLRNIFDDVIERHTPDGVSTFSYDTVGRLVAATNNHTEVQLERDAVGRVVAETVNGRTVSSAYDALGRCTRRTTPSGAESMWEYNAFDRPVALHAAGRTLRFEYDSAGRETSRSLGSGAMLTQAWGTGDELLAQHITGVAGRQERSYSYRPDGLLTGINDSRSGATAFDLDRLGRVTAVRAAGWTERYAYDAAGNIAEAGWPVSGDSPQAESVGSREHTGMLVRRAGSVRYEYDAQGRMVARHQRRLSREPATWRYFWDADDRLNEVHTPDGFRWCYRYDPFGRRVSKRCLGLDGQLVEQIEFSWDGYVLVEQAHTWPDRAGDIRITVWDYEPGTVRPVSQRERAPLRHVPQQWIDERFYSIVTDIAGSPTELVDDQGSIAWFHRTTLWGNTLEQGRTGAYTPLRFPGQYADPETGLHYNVHRYYDPTNGNYASADPLGLSAGPNPYRYVANPHLWTDPLGLTPCYVYRAVNTRDRMRLRMGMGLKPKAERIRDRNRSADSHVLHGSRVKTRFISTTTNLDKTRRYYDPRNGVVKIDLNEYRRSGGQVLDLSTREGREQHLRSATARGYAQGSSEVLLDGEVPASAIVAHRRGRLRE